MIKSLLDSISILCDTLPFTLGALNSVADNVAPAAPAPAASGRLLSKTICILIEINYSVSLENESQLVFTIVSE